MKMMADWCEELERNFDPENILNREEPFRMLNGSEEFLTTSDL